MFPDKFSIGINEEKCASFIYEWKTKISWISNLPLMHPCVSLLRVYIYTLLLTMEFLWKTGKNSKRKEKSNISNIVVVIVWDRYFRNVLRRRKTVLDLRAIGWKMSGSNTVRRIAWWYISILFWRECPSTIQAQDCKNLGSTERP